MGARRGTSDVGAAAVEFALISIILFTLLFGIVQYGFYFFQATSISAAANQGARQAAVGIEDCEEWDEWVRDTAPRLSDSILSVTSSGVEKRGATLTVTVTWDPLAFGVVPLPPGPRTETVHVRAERLDKDTSATGCP